MADGCKVEDEAKGEEQCKDSFVYGDLKCFRVTVNRREKTVPVPKSDAGRMRMRVHVAPRDPPSRRRDTVSVQWECPDALAPGKWRVVPGTKCSDVRGTLRGDSKKQHHRHRAFTEAEARAIRYLMSDKSGGSEGNTSWVDLDKDHWFVEDGTLVPGGMAVEQARARLAELEEAAADHQPTDDEKRRVRKQSANVRALEALAQLPQLRLYISRTASGEPVCRWERKLKDAKWEAAPDTQEKVSVAMDGKGYDTVPVFINGEQRDVKAGAAIRLFVTFANNEVNGLGWQQLADDGRWEWIKGTQRSKSAGRIYTEQEALAYRWFMSNPTKWVADNSWIELSTDKYEARRSVSSPVTLEKVGSFPAMRLYFRKPTATPTVAADAVAHQHCYEWPFNHTGRAQHKRFMCFTETMMLNLLKCANSKVQGGATRFSKFLEELAVITGRPWLVTATKHTNGSNPHITVKPSPLAGGKAMTQWHVNLNFGSSMVEKEKRANVKLYTDHGLKLSVRSIIGGREGELKPDAKVLKRILDEATEDRQQMTAKAVEEAATKKDEEEAADEAAEHGAA